jgi:hypothetical protein
MTCADCHQWLVFDAHHMCESQFSIKCVVTLPDGEYDTYVLFYLDSLVTRHSGSVTYLCRNVTSVAQ